MLYVSNNRNILLDFIRIGSSKLQVSVNYYQAKGEILLKVCLHPLMSLHNLESMVQWKFRVHPHEIFHGSCFDMLSIKISLIIRPFLHKPPTHIVHIMRRLHLGISSNALLVIALAIGCKRCHLLASNSECTNSISIVIST